ncbi:MAG: hypothetical protein ABEL04_13775 [Salinibacter sp.]|uniref:hypothetical protein n=1 Tax=Salinibacter sp. TaxID=2065818 RepID=UPI0035D3DDB8
MAVPALALLLLLITSPAQAQSNGEGSIYSRFGLGTLLEFSSSRSQALGGGGYALRSLNYNPGANPALWSDQVFTRLSASAAYRSISTEDGRGNSGQLASGNIQAIKFNFPISRRTLGVALSFQPYSRTNYTVTQSGTVPFGPRQKTEAPYEVSFTGSGGLHQLRGGLGYRVNEVLSVGASANFIFGILESQRRTTFEESAQGLRNVVVSDGTRLSGLTGTFGTHLTLADVFAPGDALSIGASATLPAVLTGEQFRTLDEDLARDTLATRDGQVTVPWQGRLGVAYQPNARWTFIADGLFEPWSAFSSTFPPGGTETAPIQFPVGGPQTLVDRWRLSMGAEVVPAGNSDLAGYFAQSAYRIGGYVERMYVRPVEETDLHVFAATAGISLPTSLSGTRIDVNTTVGVRGTTSRSLVRDTFFGVSLNVNFGERWFQRRKFR